MKKQTDIQTKIESKNLGYPKISCFNATAGSVDQSKSIVLRDKVIDMIVMYFKMR